MSPEIAAILTDIGRWVRSRPDLRGLALVGSHASARARANSDIDLILPTDAIAAYQDDDWVQNALGSRRAIAETRGEWFGNVWSLFVRLAEGREVEFTFAERSWTSTHPPDPEVCRVVHDGIVILHDPDGELLALCRACGVQPRTFS
jgi:hypothetical protein